MATISTETWDKRVSKIPSILNLLNSRLKIYTVKVDFEAGVNSGNRGDHLDANSRISFSLKGDSKIKEYLAVIESGKSDGLENVQISYDTENERMTVFAYQTNAFAKLNETALSNATTNILGGESVEFLVIGV